MKRLFAVVFIIGVMLGACGKPDDVYAALGGGVNAHNHSSAGAGGALMRSTSVITNSTTTVPSGSLTNVQFGDEDHDEMGAHDNAANNTRIAINLFQVTRIRVHGWVQFPAAPIGGTVRNIYFRRDGFPGGLTGGVCQTHDTAALTMLECTSPIYILSSGWNYMEMAVYQDTGASMGVTAAGFNIEFLR